MTAPKNDRDELAERMAEVFRERYAEVVEEKGHEEAYEEAQAAMQEAMKSRRTPRPAEGRTIRELASEGARFSVSKDEDDQAMRERREERSA